MWPARRAFEFILPAHGYVIGFARTAIAQLKAPPQARGQDAAAMHKLPQGTPDNGCRRLRRRAGTGRWRPLAGRAVARISGNKRRPMSNYNNRSSSEQEGIRLAKRVAALAGVCGASRTVDRERRGACRWRAATLPQSRVQAHQRVGSRRRQPDGVPVAPLYKPAGADGTAHKLLVAANHHEPERAGQRFRRCTPRGNTA
jgi:hypothetical protein